MLHFAYEWESYTPWYHTSTYVPLTDEACCAAAHVTTDLNDYLKPLVVLGNLWLEPILIVQLYLILGLNRK